MSAPAPVLAAAPPQPYKGLESYDYADHLIFSSRDREAEKLIRRITIYRSALLYGSQGAGKSSMVNAAFLPRAVAEGFSPERIRVNAQPGAEIVVSRISVKEPGRPPYLPSVFSSGDADARLVLSVDEFLERLKAAPEERLPLLVFDQFEELISQFEESPSEISRAEALELQQRLISVLVDLARSDRQRAKVLFVFRHDYLAQLGKVFLQVPNLLTNSLFLHPLGVEDLPRIIRGPFERFPNHYVPEIEPGLAAEIEAAFRARSAVGEINLSEVQIVCLEGWKSGDPAALIRGQGIQGILRGYFSSALASIPADSVDPAVALLGQLVTAGGVRNVVAGENLLALAREKGRYTIAQVSTALAQLESRTRLIRRERRGDVLLYEIVSESLIPWIRQQEMQRRIQRQRRTWIRAAVIALSVSVVLFAISLWVLGARTEAVLRDEKVQELATVVATVQKERDEQRSENVRLAAVLNRRAEEASPVEPRWLGPDQETSPPSAAVAELRKQRDALQAEVGKIREAAAQREAELTRKLTETEQSLSALRDQGAASVTGAQREQEALRAQVAKWTEAAAKAERERDAALQRLKLAGVDPELVILGDYTAYVLTSPFTEGRVALITEQIPRTGNARLHVAIGERAFGRKPGRHEELFGGRLPEGEKLKAILAADSNPMVRNFEISRKPGQNFTRSIRISTQNLNIRVIAFTTGTTSDQTLSVLVTPQP